MKRKAFALMAAVFLLQALMIPSFAWAEYGVIYDETEMLWSQELERLGTQVLPGLTQKYGIDMRVDVLIGVTGYGGELTAAAEGIYKDYGYGSGDGKNGVTLTLLVSKDETGVALEGWHPYAAGESWELTTNATWNICRNSDTWLSEEAWSGGLEQDIEALTGAVTDMAQGLENFVLAGGVASTIWNPLTQDPAGGEEPTTGEEPAVQETPSAEVIAGGNVADWAGILNEGELALLEQQAQGLTEQYSFGVYLATVQDYEELDAVDVYDAAQAVYHGYSLGCGSGRDGVLLLLSMEERDYALIVNGEYGRYAFNDSGRSAMTEFFLDDFGQDEWYEGFSDYLEWCGNYLEAAESGEPYSDRNPPMDAAARTGAIMIRVAAIVILPLTVAFVTILVLGSKMKSAAAQTRAERYVKGNLILTDSQDQYTHTTQTKEKIKKDSETKNRSSGDTAGTTGKF